MTTFNPENDPHGLMTTTQLANYLHTSASTLRRMVKDGSIPHYRIRREWRFSLQEVLDSLARGPEDEPLTRLIKDVNVEIDENDDEENQTRQERIREDNDFD